jgi:hypothetical protein
MTIETFAEKFRLKITRDECNDKIIQGRRGQLYVDAGQLCAMWLDAPYIKESRLKELGGHLWTGDISHNAAGRMVRDAKVTGIAPEHHRLAIRLVSTRPKREMSEAQLTNLAKARAASPIYQKLIGGR